MRYFLIFDVLFLLKKRIFRENLQGECHSSKMAFPTAEVSIGSIFYRLYLGNTLQRERERELLKEIARERERERGRDSKKDR